MALTGQWAREAGRWGLRERGSALLGGSGPARGAAVEGCPPHGCGGTRLVVGCSPQSPVKKPLEEQARKRYGLCFHSKEVGKGFLKYLVLVQVLLVAA